MQNRLVTAVVSGFVGVVALATVASAEPAGLKLAGLMNGLVLIVVFSNPNRGGARCLEGSVTDSE